jgi:hypothetical protein
LLKSIQDSEHIRGFTGITLKTDDEFSHVLYKSLRIY